MGGQPRLGACVVTVVAPRTRGLLLPFPTQEVVVVGYQCACCVAVNIYLVNFLYNKYSFCFYVCCLEAAAAACNNNAYMHALFPNIRYILMPSTSHSSKSCNENTSELLRVSECTAVNAATRNYCFLASDFAWARCFLRPSTDAAGSPNGSFCPACL